MEREDATKTADYLVKNRELHFSLYRACQMPTLVKIIESRWLQIGPLLTIQQGIYVNAGITVQTHHRRLLKALRKRNAEEARVSIVDDIEDAAKLIAEAL
jgi:DNA-binding GntR family transcriptional regulator